MCGCIATECASTSASAIGSSSRGWPRRRLTSATAALPSLTSILATVHITVDWRGSTYSSVKSALTRKAPQRTHTPPPDDNPVLRGVGDDGHRRVRCSLLAGCFRDPSRSLRRLHAAAPVAAGHARQQ